MTELLDLATRLRQSGVPTHFPEDQARLLIAVWRRVAQGEPVPRKSISRIASDLGQNSAAALPFIEQVSEFDKNGDVVGIFGLSQRTHPHKFILGARAFSTWCAWDALFLPPMLQRPARIESRCPATKVTITVDLSHEGIHTCNPENAVLSIVLPSSDKSAFQGVEEVWSSFCCNVHFFQSEADARSWFAGKTVDVRFLSVAQGFELGLHTFAEILEQVS